MTFLQALRYFVREALLGMVRSWKISLLAIGTIAVSLFLAGIFVLIAGNLKTTVAGWRGESRIVVYLAPESEPAAIAEIAATAGAVPWVASVREVSPAQARERFTRAFPGLSDLLEGWGSEPLPSSLEIAGAWSGVDRAAFEAWLDRLRALPAVTMVDDDRDWLAQLEGVALLLRGLGAALGGVLLLTAIFTIASVIRLTVYLVQDEIAVMRLVGATEFFIRGPFYVQGLLQGVAGSGAAVLALGLGHRVLRERAGEQLLVSMLARDFLGAGEVVALLALGGLAGLTGAVVSLRKEELSPADPQ